MDLSISSYFVVRNADIFALSAALIAAERKFSLIRGMIIKEFELREVCKDHFLSKKHPR